MTIQNSYLIKFYNLEHYFKKLLLNNQGNYNPYHNLQHTLNVLNLCLDIANSENLSHEETRIVLISAIFHDFNYSLIFHYDLILGFPTPERNEKLNIGSAISAFKEYSIENENDNQKIISLIKSTNSYEKLENPDILEKILYDADRLCWISDSWLQDIFMGLFASEWNIGLKYSLNKEFEFISNLKPFTKRGKEFYAIESSNKLEEIKYLMEIIK